MDRKFENRTLLPAPYENNASNGIGDGNSVFAIERAEGDERLILIWASDPSLVISGSRKLG
jgi:hypothetical protein